MAARPERRVRASARRAGGFLRHERFNSNGHLPLRKGLEPIQYLVALAKSLDPERV